MVVDFNEAILPSLSRTLKTALSLPARLRRSLSRSVHSFFSIFFHAAFVIRIPLSLICLHFIFFFKQFQIHADLFCLTRFFISVLVKNNIFMNYDVDRWACVLFCL